MDDTALIYQNSDGYYFGIFGIVELSFVFGTVAVFSFVPFFVYQLQVLKINREAQIKER